MAVNPVQFLVASNASILDGTKTVTISGGVNASRVFSGTAVFLGGADNPAEAISGTAPDGSGISTITLRNNWTQGDISNQPLVAFNTNEGLAEAISNVREIVSNVSAIEDLATQGLIKRIDDDNYEVVDITSLGESLVGANDAGTARSVLGLGSAATKDVGTTSGNVMEVGAFGLGSLDCPTISDLTQEVEAGLYKFRADYTGAPSDTAGTTFWYSLLVTQSLQDRVTFLAQLVTGSDPRLFLGERVGKTGSIRWTECFTSANSVNPLDYGLGLATSSAESITDFGLNKQSGFYKSVGGVTDAPETPTFNSSVLTYPASTGTNFLYQRNVAAESDIKAWLGCTRPQTGDVAWAEIYHSGNSVNPLDYGLGRVITGAIIGEDKATKNDLNTSSQPTQAFVFDSATLNRPTTHYGGTVANGVGLTISRTDNIWGQITISRSSGNLGETVIRAKDGSTIKERTVFDSGNTNFNEFSATGAGDIIAIGWAFSPTGCTFILPIVSHVMPSGITVSGTEGFEIGDKYSQALLHSNITSIGLTARSSTRFCVIEVTGLSGFTVGQELVLRSRVGSKLIVNF